ncbi:unnamed protein product [Mytilus coruscus]|uniref:Uncharacterized protein n=1 Tax=Mytilus coruscus TaxID=42192 RepID=A0A6J8DMW0_MYTCO|nr:unnamed protein product [Mytilus coruscus]
MVAQYELEAAVIAANQEKTKYMLLSNQEIDKCSNPLVNFCEIKSPVYPVNLSKLCVIALFANKEYWKAKCTVKVRPNTVLPMATYLTDSMWAVTTINEFRITIRCDDKTNMLTDQIINPPTTIINLKRACTATSDHLTLLPTYQMERHVQLPESDSQGNECTDIYGTTTENPNTRSIHGRSVPPSNEYPVRRTFSGASNDVWNEFIQYFENLSELNVWNNEKSRRILLSTLRGQA